MRHGIALACVLALAGPGSALAAASGDQIRAAVSDATIQGNMDSSGPYAEFYQGDGTIRGSGYTGTWSVEGDTMCFAYQNAPKDCLEVEISGDQVRWLKNGQSLGTGTILKGNANGF